MILTSLADQNAIGYILRLYCQLQPDLTQANFSQVFGIQRLIGLENT